jgi:hypothetical protein
LEFEVSNTFMEQSKNFFQTKTFSKILWCVAGLIMAGLIFQAGIFVGYYKASFSYRLGDEYHSIFGDRNSLPGQNGEEFSGAYGASGDILKIDLPNIVIEGQNSVEETVVLSTSTIFRSMRDTIKATDLKTDDFVVVIGQPNDNGQIEAKLVRVVPPPPGYNDTSDTPAQSAAEQQMQNPPIPNQ